MTKSDFLGFGYVLDAMEVDLVKELFRTVILFMTSNNREIIKAALGFIKVAVVTLNQEYLEDDLETIVPGIIGISRDHKSHFRSKVRHILERIIRRFSFEAVEGFVPETDRKLIANIRKRRERIKKKKAAARQTQLENGGADSEDEVDPMRAALKNKRLMQSRQKEYEDAIRSDSELEDSDEDDDDNFIPEQFKDAFARKVGGPLLSHNSMFYVTVGPKFSVCCVAKETNVWSHPNS
jgi:ribosomal RNA-processing protein 12